MDRSRLRARSVAGAVLAVVAVGAVVVSPDAVFARASWLAADPVRLVAAAIVLAAIRPLVAWPTTLLAVLLGYGLGVWGFPLALALVTLTSVPPFLLARRYGRIGAVAAAGEAFVERTGDVRSVIASRLVPAPSDIVSVAAGVAGVSLPAFLVGTAIGEIPWVFLGILAGASAERVTAAAIAGAFDLRVVAVVGLAALALLAPTAYGWYAERHRAGGGPAPDGE
ncbi:MAG: TVP38/TMEM64 family protein [Halobellus sp.]|uniref:TVP38/TMEM64 family protein n=1 Tax=Halobellus sp. TaxID=1979212 RepID=UPI0035D4ACF3